MRSWEQIRQEGQQVKQAHANPLLFAPPSRLPTKPYIPRQSPSCSPSKVSSPDSTRRSPPP